MSTFGSLYRVTTFGESHCKAVGVIVDGCPPGLHLTEDDVQPQLNRRRPGQSNLTTPRDEKDKVVILSGTEKGFSLGTPIAMQVPNLDQRPHDYGEMDYYPRPSHADYTYLEKYGIKASSGGGRSSARETIGRVAAAAVAEKYLRLTHGIEIVAFVNSIGNVSLDPTTNYTVPADAVSWMRSWQTWWSTLANVTRAQVDATEVRCPDPNVAQQMRARIVEAKEASDSIGGTVVCVIRNLPRGLGEPAFDKLEAKLAHAMLSIPATKGFEIGSGFAGTTVPGHIHNDPFVKKEDGSLGTKTNFSGGIQGGISNGENVYFKVAFKPAATIGQPQETTTYGGTDGVLAAKGRHDPSVLPRAVPIVEAMATLVVMDTLLVQLSRKSAMQLLPREGVPPILTGELEKSR
ncbi:chorismate synthase [Cladochytrium replicatum]|nr:chorismate synthase [Cladochytrium replicatum]